MRALAAAVEAQERVECIREPLLFRDMYRALGDRAVQDALRQSTPNQNHCYLLIKDAKACVRLPEDLDDTYRQGDMCPNNPLIRPENAAVFEQSEQQMDIAERASMLSQMAKLNMLDPDRITPAEFQSIVAVESHRSAMEAQTADRARRDTENTKS